MGYSKRNLKLESLFTCDLNYFETLVSEREGACKGERKAQISGCTAGREYRRVTEAGNFTTTSGITCINSEKARKLSKNFGFA